MSDRGMLIVASRASAAKRQGMFLRYRWHLECLEELLAISHAFAGEQWETREGLHTELIDRLREALPQGALAISAPVDGFEEDVYALRLDDWETWHEQVHLETSPAAVVDAAWRWLESHEEGGW